MNVFPMALPDTLPGINVAFGLRQCLGNTDLFSTLLHKFQEDYADGQQKFLHHKNGTESTDEALHTLKGVATNLGMPDLSNLCQDLRDQLKSTPTLPQEPVERLHKELEKIGSSIKTLDSFLQS